MTDIENRAKEAFLSIEPPPHLNEETLAAIEQRREAEAENKPEARTKPEAEGRFVAVASAKRKPRRWTAAAAAAACLVLVAVGIFAIAPGEKTTDTPDTGVITNPNNPGSESFEGSSEINAQDLPLNLDEPTAFVTLDMNPSIELQLNALDNVIAVEGLNEDGRTVLANLSSSDTSLIGLPVNEALPALTSSDAFAAYLHDDSHIALTVICSDDAQQKRVLNVGSAYVSSLPCQGSCSVANSEEHQDAAAKGMGVQRYRAAKELIAADPSLTWEDCQSMSMRELRDRLAGL